MVRAADGKAYVLSEEGLEYEVAIELSAPFPATPPGHDYQCALKIDGEDVGYVKCHLRAGQSAVFEGFCAAATNHGAQYRRFKFAKLQQQGGGGGGGPTVRDPEEIAAGRIRIEVGLYRETGQYRSAPEPVTKRRAAAHGKLPEGKKFFLAPSTQTAEGASTYNSSRWNLAVYQLVQDCASVELRYEAASMLMLRGVLNKASAAHQQLLRLSRDPGAFRPLFRTRGWGRTCHAHVHCAGAYEGRKAGQNVRRARRRAAPITTSPFAHHRSPS